MKRSFIFLSCLFCLAVLQANPLVADCGCGKKKPPNPAVFFSGGCGCDEGGGRSDELPSAE